MLYRFVEDFGFEQGLFVGVDDAKGGVDSEGIEVFCYEAFAEGMNGADVCGVEGEELTSKVGVVVLAELHSQLVRDAGAHLLCGGVGEGQHEHLGNVCRIVVVGEEVGASSGKYGGFTCAGRGGYEDISSNSIDGEVLL